MTPTLNELRTRLREAAKLATPRRSHFTEELVVGFSDHVNFHELASPQNILLLLEAMDAAEERGFRRAVEMMRSGAAEEFQINVNPGYFLWAHWLEEQMKGNRK